jgi:hypothetical protein
VPLGVLAWPSFGFIVRNEGGLTFTFGSAGGGGDCFGAPALKGISGCGFALGK